MGPSFSHRLGWVGALERSARPWGGTGRPSSGSFRPTGWPCPTWSLQENFRLFTQQIFSAYDGSITRVGYRKQDRRISCSLMSLSPGGVFVYKR